MKDLLRGRLGRLLENRMRRSVALALAIIVTFSTTYSLVLPAITLEKDTAETMSGVSLSENGQVRDTSAFPPEAEPSDPSDRGAEAVSFDAEAKNEDGENFFPIISLGSVRFPLPHPQDLY